MVQPSALVVLTRAPADNQPLRERLEAAGVRVLELPTAQFVDVPLEIVALDSLRTCQAMTFASPHAVQALARQVGPKTLVNMQQTGVIVGAVGPVTAQVLADLGVRADAVAQRPSTGEQLAELLLPILPKDAQVTAFQAMHSQPELTVRLAAAGHAITHAIVYANTEPPRPHAPLLHQAEEARAIYLAAPSAADRLLAWAPRLRHCPLVAIGPTTAAALRQHHGVMAVAVSSTPELDDVARTLLARCT